MLRSVAEMVAIILSSVGQSVPEIYRSVNRCSPRVFLANHLVAGEGFSLYNPDRESCGRGENHADLCFSLSWPGHGTMMLSRKAARRGHFLLKKVNRTIREYHTIHDGDRIAVAVSGGKDSLSLLTLLRLREQRIRQHYELMAVHVWGDARGPACPPPLDLVDGLQRQGLPFAVEPVDLLPDESLPMPCQRCTWNRRKTIFQIADRLGCNVVAFAHHADDLAHTTLLNLFFGGRVETMAPTADYFDGHFRLIRPLAFVPEKDLAYLARVCDFPSLPSGCPQAEDNHRALVAQVLCLFHKDAHRVRTNLVRAALRNSGSPDP
jgi:tRNA 2-thiocytidine biosynthesis protein TtcA